MLSSIMGAALWISLIILAIVGIIIFMAWRRGVWIFKKFPTPTIVFNMLANGPEVYTSWLRFYKDGDKDMMELKNGDFRGPKFPDKELMWGEYAILVIPEVGEAHPTGISMDKVQLVDKNGKVYEKDLLKILPLIRHDSKTAFINELERNSTLFKLETWLGKYGIYMIFAVVVIFSFLILQNISGMISQALSQNTQAAERLAQASEKLAEAVNRTGYILPGGG